VKGEAVCLSTEEGADLRHARIYAYHGMDYIRNSRAVRVSLRNLLHQNPPPRFQGPSAVIIQFIQPVPFILD
jgi:hypothetical protein